MGIRTQIVFMKLTAGNNSNECVISGMSCEHPDRPNIDHQDQQE